MSQDEELTERIGKMLLASPVDEYTTMIAVEPDDLREIRDRLEALAQPVVEVEQEPVAYRHTMHMEGGQTMVKLSDWDGKDDDDPRVTAFGIPGRDYSEEYPVTTDPLYLGAPIYAENPNAASPSPVVGDREAIAEVACVETVPIEHPFSDEVTPPIWRVIVGEYCADFDYEQAARNFAGAINDALSLSTPVVGGAQ